MSVNIAKYKTLTVRLPPSLMEALTRTAEARGATISELVRGALLTSVELDPATQRHASLLYEIAKTRALLVRFLDTQLDPTQVEQLLAAAEEAATEYAHERIGADKGEGCNHGTP
jgi:hypothetical protein